MPKRQTAGKTRQKAAPQPTLAKADPALPCLIVTGREKIAVRAGTKVGTVAFARRTPVRLPASGLVAGGDYYVALDPTGRPFARLAEGLPGDEDFAGFHFAPAGNAPWPASGEAKGGDTVPAINPHSCWDRVFRPACPDPRGMALVAGHFWADIYLLGTQHLTAGTSRLGAVIADGNNLPDDPAGKGFIKFDHAAACAVMAHHGKSLLGAEEFFIAALGVTERSAAGTDPVTTRLDAARTSCWGLMQATGNMWVWGHDGHPRVPRASIFGGSWLYDVDAGSRSASLGYWPENSYDSLGVRGRSDHLTPDRRRDSGGATRATA